MQGVIFGFLSGFIGSIPVSGPIALLVFRNSMQGHYEWAQRIVLGAALAEAGYCALALFGYIQLIQAFPSLASYIRLIGAIFLFVLGIFFLVQKVHIQTEGVTTTERKGAPFLTGFLIAAFNPTLFLTWGSANSIIFSWLEITGLWDMLLFPIFAGIGIIVWFFILVAVFKRYREKIGERIGNYAIRAAAFIILGSGVYLLFQAIS